MSTSIFGQSEHKEYIVSKASDIIRMIFESDFKKGDPVEAVILGNRRKGKITRIHSTEIMADVDFGNGDIYGIMFSKMKNLRR